MLDEDGAGGVAAIFQNQNSGNRFGTVVADGNDNRTPLVETKSSIDAGNDVLDFDFSPKAGGKNKNTTNNQSTY